MFSRHSGSVRYLGRYAVVDWNSTSTADRKYEGVAGGKVNILGGHSIGHSKQNTLYEHVSYSERFPR